MVQVPSVGRVVHYVLGTWDAAPGSVGEHRPAVIVKVWGETPDSRVQLQVLMDGDGLSAANDGTPNVVWRTSVARDDDARTPGTYHFPEFVPPAE